MNYFTTEDLRLLLEDLPKEYELIDVRNPEEWAEGVIQDTRLLSLPLIPLHLQDFSPEKTYIFICRSGARSSQAAHWLEQHGIPHVINYEDGMLGWKEEGLPTIIPDLTTYE